MALEYKEGGDRAHHSARSTPRRGGKGPVSQLVIESRDGLVVAQLTPTSAQLHDKKARLIRELLPDISPQDLRLASNQYSLPVLEVYTRLAHVIRFGRAQESLDVEAFHLFRTYGRIFNKIPASEAGPEVPDFEFSCFPEAITKAVNEMVADFYTTADINQLASRIFSVYAAIRAFVDEVVAASRAETGPLASAFQNIFNQLTIARDYRATAGFNCMARGVLRQCFDKDHPSGPDLYGDPSYRGAREQLRLIETMDSYLQRLDAQVALNPDIEFSALLASTDGDPVYHRLLSDHESSVFTYVRAKAVIVRQERAREEAFAAYLQRSEVLEELQESFLSALMNAVATTLLNCRGTGFFNYVLSIVGHELTTVIQKEDVTQVESSIRDLIPKNLVGSFGMPPDFAPHQVRLLCLGHLTDEEFQEKFLDPNSDYFALETLIILSREFLNLAAEGLTSSGLRVAELAKAKLTQLNELTSQDCSVLACSVVEDIRHATAEHDLSFLLNRLIILKDYARGDETNKILRAIEENTRVDEEQRQQLNDVVFTIKHNLMSKYKKTTKSVALGAVLGVLGVAVLAVLLFVPGANVLATSIAPWLLTTLAAEIVGGSAITGSAVGSVAEVRYAQRLQIRPSYTKKGYAAGVLTGVVIAAALTGLVAFGIFTFGVGPLVTAAIIGGIALASSAAGAGVGKIAEARATKKETPGYRRLSETEGLPGEGSSSTRDIQDLLLDSLREHQDQVLTVVRPDSPTLAASPVNTRTEVMRANKSASGLAVGSTIDAVAQNCGGVISLLLALYKPGQTDHIVFLNVMSTLLDKMLATEHVDEVEVEPDEAVIQRVTDALSKTAIPQEAITLAAGEWRSRRFAASAAEGDGQAAAAGTLDGDPTQRLLTSSPG